MTPDMAAEEFIIVGTTDYGDHDRILKLLGPVQGRTAALVRGVRRGSQPWHAILEPGTVIRPSFKRSRGPLPVIAEAALVSRPRRSREDLDRLAALTYGLELCSSLAPEHHEAHKLVRLLMSWLDLLESEDVPGAASRQALEAKALTFAGLAPALVICPVCDTRITDPAVFDASAGGGAHRGCGQGSNVQADALLRLEALRRTPLADTPGVRPVAPLGLLADFIEYSLGRALRARTLLDELMTSSDLEQ
jgi:DNA repair protein RecO